MALKTKPLFGYLETIDSKESPWVIWKYHEKLPLSWPNMYLYWKIK